MTNEQPKVCILDCYFTPLDDNGEYYKISDKELTKFITSVRALEHEKDVVIARHKFLIRIYTEKIQELKYEKHVYKVELGRCVRKLTRIYDYLYKAGFYNYVWGRSDFKPKEIVDIFKDM